MAPEVLAGGGAATFEGYKQADQWALGVLFFALMTASGALASSWEGKMKTGSQRSS